MIRSNCLKEQFSLYALSKLEFSKLKFSKHYWYFKYLLILSGDINLHPGPVQYPCSVCAKPVKKRLISCEKCGLWIHKRCNQFEKPRIGSLLTCRPCQNKPIDHLDNIWHQFTFADDFFEDRDAPSDEQTNIDLAHQVQSTIGKSLTNVDFIWFIWTLTACYLKLTNSVL